MCRARSSAKAVCTRGRAVLCCPHFPSWSARSRGCGCGCGSLARLSACMPLCLACLYVRLFVRLPVSCMHACMIVSFSSYSASSFSTSTPSATSTSYLPFLLLRSLSLAVSLSFSLSRSLSPLLASSCPSPGPRECHLPSFLLVCSTRSFHSPHGSSYAFLLMSPTPPSAVLFILSLLGVSFS